MPMKEGLLWADHSNHTLREKISKLALHFKNRSDTPPNTCHVNPGDLEEFNGGQEFTMEVDGIGVISVKPDQYVLPNKFWIGVSDLTS